MSYLRSMGDAQDDLMSLPGSDIPPPFNPPTAPEVPDNPFQVTQPPSQYLGPELAAQRAAAANTTANANSSGAGGGGGSGGGAWDFSSIGNKFPALLSSSSGGMSPVLIGALAVGAVLLYKSSTKKKRKNPARRRR